MVYSLTSIKWGLELTQFLSRMRADSGRLCRLGLDFSRRPVAGFLQPAAFGSGLHEIGIWFQKIATEAVGFV
jgi:hypothetical protein